MELLRSVVPEICEVIEKIDARLKHEYPNAGLAIIKGGSANMANICRSTSPPRSTASRRSIRRS